MKKVIFIVCIIFSISCSQKTVPLFLRATINDIDKNLNDTVKFDFRTYPEDISTTKHHFGLGLNIRNERNLWKEGFLKISFRFKGIHHPDDMSSIILTSYHRKLNGKDINFKEQKKFYKTYWKLIKQNKDKFATWYNDYESRRTNYEDSYSIIFKKPRKVMGYGMAFAENKKGAIDVKYIAESVSVDKYQINIKILDIQPFNEEYKLNFKVDDTIKVLISDIYLIP